MLRTCSVTWLFGKMDPTYCGGGGGRLQVPNNENNLRTAGLIYEPRPQKINSNKISSKQQQQQQQIKSSRFKRYTWCSAKPANDGSFITRSLCHQQKPGGPSPAGAPSPLIPHDASSGGMD